MKTPTQTAFGEWLKAERVRRGWSQTQLGVKVDLTKAQISRIESGIQGTKIPTARRIAEAMGADPRDALRALTGEDAPTTTDEIVLGKGQRVRIVAREGEAGTVLDLDETTLAVLEALSGRKQTTEQ